jgi:hypothetical protein
LELNSSQTFLTIKRCEGTKIGKVIKQSRTSILLTEIEEEYGINNIMQDEPKMSDEQRTVLVTNNSGLNFLSVPTKVTGGEVIEILNDDEEDVLNEYIRN